MASSVAEQRYQELKDKGFQTYFFIAQNANAGVPDAAYCKQVRTQYKLTMPVLYGAASLLTPLGITGEPNDWNLVIQKGGKLNFRKKPVPQSTVHSTILGLLP